MVNTSGMKAKQPGAAEIFAGLESQSVLYMLHHCTKLSTLDPDVVLNMLSKCPLLQGEGKYINVYNRVEYLGFLVTF